MSDNVDQSENPYCMRCGKHLSISFHETNEHDAARAGMTS